MPLYYTNLDLKKKTRKTSLKSHTTIIMNLSNYTNNLRQHKKNQKKTNYKAINIPTLENLNIHSNPFILFNF